MSIIQVAPSGGDDTSAINSALSTSGVSQVLLTGGTYSVSGTITVPANVTLLGAGWATVINATGSQATLIHVTGNYAAVRNLMIQGSCGDAIGVDTCIEVLVDRVNIEGGASTTIAKGVHVYGSTGYFNRIHNCRIDACSSHGIHLDGAGALEAELNNINIGGYNTTTYGVQVSGIDQATLHHIEVLQCVSRGIHVTGCGGVLMDGLSIDSGGGIGLLIEAQVRGENRVSNSWVGSNGDSGVYVVNSTVRLENSEIGNNAQHGVVLIQNASYPVNEMIAFVDGCRIWDNSVASPGAAHGIVNIGAITAIITGNYIGKIVQPGITPSGTQGWGAVLDAASKGVADANVTHGNSAGPISFGGVSPGTNVNY